MKKYLKLILLTVLVWSMGQINAYAVNVEETSLTSLSEDSLSNLGASGLYVSKDNTLYIADTYKNQIYKYDGTNLTLLAGNANLIMGIPSPGYHDGIAEYTLFNEPYMAIPWGNGVLVSDTENHALRYIEDGLVETYAGGELGYKDGEAEDALFNRPTGLAIDDAQNVYIADTGNGVIRKMDKNGFIITYAEGFQGPMGLFWYEDTLYVTDVVTNQIFTIQNGQTTLLTGQAIQEDEEWISGYQDGSIDEATFSLPQGIYVDETGIYIGDTGNNTVRQITDGQVTTCELAKDFADPVGITKYNGELLVGDPFIKTTQGTITSTSGTTGTTLEEDTQNDSENGQLEIQDPSAISQGITTQQITWIGLALLALAIILAAVILWIKVASKNKEKE